MAEQIHIGAIAGFDHIKIFDILPINTGRPSLGAINIKTRQFAPPDFLTNVKNKIEEGATLVSGPENEVVELLPLQALLGLAQYPVDQIGMLYK